jgi:multidrug resistance efflux pump
MSKKMIPLHVADQAVAACEAEIQKLKEENAALKAEVERLTFDPMSYWDEQGEWMPRHVHIAAVERLKAEVERLNAIVSADAIDREHGMCCDASAQVERLTKAGDAAIEHLRWQGGKHTKEVIISAWHAAKGVQS